MSKAQKKLRPKKIILKTILIFLCSYLIFLILWIQVKDHYGYMITFIASNMVMVFKNIQFEEITEEKGLIQATFSRPFKSQADLLLDVPIKTSSYTFNVPLTLGIMAALFPFMRKRWRAYLEALIILLGVHLLYVFSFEANSLTTMFVGKGLEAMSKPRLFAYQFLWEFTNNMVIRFEPFLIGCYVFIRFKK